MKKLPNNLQEEYSKRGDSFVELAEYFYRNYDREFTQSDLKQEVGVSQSRISDFTTELADSGWITKNRGRTTYGWNTERHHPARTDGSQALTGFYKDLRWLINKHSRTLSGSFALLGCVMFIGTVVLLGFYIGYLVSGDGGSAVSGATYLIISAGSLLVGVVITLLAQVQGWLARAYYWVSSRARSGR